MEEKTNINVSELSEIISATLKSQTDYTELRVKSIARETAKEVVKELIPVITTQMRESSSDIAKRVVKDACVKLVLEVTGEEYTDRKKVREAIQWSIETKDKSNLISNRIIVVATSLVTGAALLPLVDWIKKIVG